jgi:hypothetical protein
VTAPSEPFYALEADGALRPLALAAGPPWLPGTQHGSAVTALMARAVEAVPCAVPMQLQRLTVDLARPVPIGATEVHAHITRDGRRVQAVDLVLTVDGSARSRASALRMRRDAGVIATADAPPPWSSDDIVGVPGTATMTSPLGADALWDAHDARWVRAVPGDGGVWLRPHRALVEGEAPSATVRAAMVADLVMSGGGIVPAERYLVVNVDLSLHLTRPPSGEWIHVRSRVHLGEEGSGLTEGTLADEQGPFGRVLKSLLVDRREPR